MTKTNHTRQGYFICICITNKVISSQSRGQWSDSEVMLLNLKFINKFILYIKCKSKSIVIKVKQYIINVIY